MGNRTEVSRVFEFQFRCSRHVHGMCDRCRNSCLFANEGREKCLREKENDGSYCPAEEEDSRRGNAGKRKCVSDSEGEAGMSRGDRRSINQEAVERDAFRAWRRDTYRATFLICAH